MGNLLSTEVIIFTDVEPSSDVSTAELVIENIGDGPIAGYTLDRCLEAIGSECGAFYLDEGGDLVVKADRKGASSLLKLGFEGLGTVFGAGESYKTLLWGSSAGCLVALAIVWQGLYRRQSWAFWGLLARSLHVRLKSEVYSPLSSQSSNTPKQNWRFSSNPLWILRSSYFRFYD